MWLPSPVAVPLAAKHLPNRLPETGFNRFQAAFIERYAMKQYQVLQDHNGEVPYLAGQTRHCPEALGQILVEAGVLAEIEAQSAPKAKASRAAPKNKAAKNAHTGND